MRPSAFMTSFGTLAAVFALALAGCKYSTLAGQLPGPSPAPTFKPGVVSEKGIPTAGATPFGITSAPDGNVWFAELNGNRLGHAVPGTFPASGSVVECGPLPAAASGPADVTVATGSPKVWFDEVGSTNEIGSVDTSNCQYSEFLIPTANAGPSGLTADQSGNLWFAEFNTAKITKMTIGGSFTEYPTGLSNSAPAAVAIAGDNSVWYLDSGRNSVGHLTFPGGVATFVDYGIPTNPSDPVSMTLGPDGALWFTELGIGSLTGCQIGRITTGASPSITEYVMNFPQPSPDGDVCLGLASAGGAIWFGEADTGVIGRVTTGGVVTEYGIPGSGTTALFVTDGPDGNLWFTDGGFDPNISGVGTNQIGRVKIGMVPALSTVGTFKATMSTRRLPLLNAKGGVIKRVDGRPH